MGREGLGWRVLGWGRLFGGCLVALGIWGFCVVDILRVWVVGFQVTRRAEGDKVFDVVACHVLAGVPMVVHALRISIASPTLARQYPRAYLLP